MHAPEIATLSDGEVAEMSGWLRTELRAFNEKFFGPHQAVPIASVAKVDGVVVGAVGGTLILDWLSVDYAFVLENYRGLRVGASLMSALELEGKRRGAQRAFVDTTSFQAEGFYQKLGYVEWGRFKEFAPGVDRIYLRKDKL